MTRAFHYDSFTMSGAGYNVSVARLQAKADAKAAAELAPQAEDLALTNARRLLDSGASSGSHRRCSHFQCAPTRSSSGFP